MSEFDKVVGYEGIKKELLQICDMIHNPDNYRNLGARMPVGILLEGNPGLGKTLMVNCFIKESGLKAYTLRRDATTADFIRSIKETFENAKEYNGQTIVFLDDLDKFADEDKPGRNAEEYVAVQSAIDDARDDEVLVIATANNSNMLPPSLLRPGRFDRVIPVDIPGGRDAENIIIHYLSGKKVSEDVNMKDISKMMSYSSCAELEAMLNDAAIRAGYAKHERIEKGDIVDAVLKEQYWASDDDYELSQEMLPIYALHEAGHLVVSEVLCPGSVGLATIRRSLRNGSGGFVHQCMEYPDSEYRIMVCLAGKAAVETKHAGQSGRGCYKDTEKAYRLINNMLTGEGSHGLTMVTPGGAYFKPSESLRSRLETVTQAEMERYMAKVRDILNSNREFLEVATSELLDKETLLYSDIKRLRENAIIEPMSSLSCTNMRGIG